MLDGLCGLWVAVDVPELRTNCGRRRWYHRHTAASVCILLDADTMFALPSYGGGAQASSKSSMFQLSLVTSFLTPLSQDTAAATELHSTNRFKLTSLCADSSALMAPAIDGVMTSFGSDDIDVTDAT